MNIASKTLAAVGVVALCALGRLAAAHDGKLTFAPVLKQVTPAVVNIQVAGNRAQRHPLFDDPAFRRFFRFRGPSRDAPVVGAGAGVIIDADEGYVVTNHHVIDDADEITVELEDRRKFKAELVGSDTRTDIALLKIDAEDLKALPLGDSDRLSVGDFVVAVGNPFSLGHTVTSGIVSALGREIFGARDAYQDFIQTDAAINRGNSGGPLVDLDGRMVGINSVIVTPSGASAGVGFAVPSNIVQAVTRQLVEHGSVRRGLLGVTIMSLTPDAAEALGLDIAEGVLVSEVMADSAAEAAGIKAQDVIVSVDGEEVAEAGDLQVRIGLTQPGSEVDIGLVRDGERMELEATVGGAGEPRSARGASGRLAGARLAPVSRMDETHGRLHGVEVTDVDEGSRAWRSGLRGGDLILRVNRMPVTSVEELDDALETSSWAGLLVLRGARRMFITLQ